MKIDRRRRASIKIKRGTLLAGEAQEPLETGDAFAVSTDTGYSRRASHLMTVHQSAFTYMVQISLAYRVRARA
jgi:hypothetical protein